ncbi:MAG TPA: CPBP family intramembrane glutamic endopeptidase [Gammaproteobacteria bacterium]
MLNLNIDTLIVFGLLSLAMLSVWLPARLVVLKIPVWMGLFGLSALGGFYFNIVEAGGVLYLAALMLLCHLTVTEKFPAPLRVACGFMVVGLVVLLFLHAVPYFHNPPVFDNVYLSERSTAYTKYWNYDKAAAGLIMLAYFGEICRSAVCFKNTFRLAWPAALITVVVTLSLAAGSGYLAPDFKFGTTILVWAWGNLFFTCVAEEMLFRGVVQRYLSVLNPSRTYRLFIVALVGVLFGLAHSGGGPVYVVLASVAGIGYGYVYYRSGRIETAILTHFLLNAAHVVFFTYPMLRI